MSDLIYWIAMVLIVGASIALLTGTFLSIRKNKREKNKKTGRVAAYAEDYEEDEEDEDSKLALQISKLLSEEDEAMLEEELDGLLKE